MDIVDAYAAHNHEPYIGRYMLDTSTPWKVAVLWIPCMISHGVDLFYKICRLAAYLILAIGMTLGVILTFGQFSNVNTQAKRMWLLAADTLVTMGVDLVGLIVPYLAYKIDDYVVSNFTKKHFDIINPYHFWDDMSHRVFGKSAEDFYKEFYANIDPNWSDEEFDRWYESTYGLGIPNTSASDKDYQLLGLFKNATLSEVRNAYKKLALQYHPDKNPSPEAQGQFQEICAAYQRLLHACKN